MSITIETHMHTEQSITIEEFTWIGHSGVNVRNRWIRCYSCTKLLTHGHYSNYEDTLCITSNVCHLPPSSSSRGDKSLEFFTALRMPVVKMGNLGVEILMLDALTKLTLRPPSD